MSTDYWLRQSQKPLFPDILWSRPESKMGAGKLLIIGGNSFGFAAPATAFAAASKAGAGVTRILLPVSLQKLVGNMPDTFFAPQNPSGSFSKLALAEMLTHASWSDAVLLAGELGRNSETAVTLELFTKTYNGPLVITRDAADYFIQTPQDILKRQQTCLVVSYEQLQKIATHSNNLHALTFSMNTQATAQWLHDFTLLHPAIIVTLHNQQLFVAVNGHVVSHPYQNETKIWRVAVAASASVFWLQNPSKPLESIASSFVQN